MSLVFAAPLEEKLYRLIHISKGKYDIFNFPNKVKVDKRIQ